MSASENAAARRVTLVPVEVPERHRAMIARLYEWVGAPGRLEGSPPGVLDGLRDDRATTEITVRLTLATSVARLSVSGIGSDLPERLRGELRRLRESDFRVVEASVDMARPGAAGAATLLEELGFVFTGVLPAGPATELVTFQYFNGVIVDYDQMKIESDETRELVAYVRGLHPDA